MPTPAAPVAPADNSVEPPISPQDPKTFTPEPFGLNLSDPTAPFVPPTQKEPALPRPLTPPPAGDRPNDRPNPQQPPQNKSKNPLRDEVERTNAELKQLREEREKEAAELRKQLEDERRQREEIAQQHQQLSERYQTIERERGMENPLEAPEVRALADPWNDQRSRIARDIQLSGGRGDFVTGSKNLIDMFAKIGDPSTDGYEERRNAFNEAVGAYGEEHARDIRRLVADGFELKGKIATVIDDISRNSQDYQYRREQKMWEEISKDFEKDESTFFKPAPELKEADPYNAHVIVTEMLGGSDEGKKRMADIRKWVRFALLPPAPVNPAELAKMTQEEQASYLEKRVTNHAQAQRHLRNILPVALASQALVPTLVKRNQELEEEVKKLRGTTPRPPLHEEGGFERRESPQNADIKGFQPVNPLLEQELASRR